MRNHRHVGVYGAVIKNGKILLVRKARGAYIGKLDLPGGGIEHAETPEDCLKREIEEETGLIVKNFNLVDVFSWNVRWDDTDGVENLHHIGIMYKVECEKGKNKKGADGLDSLGSDWYDINNLTRDELSPFACMILDKLGHN